MIWSTTPRKGEQALIAKWKERTKSGFQLMIDASGALALRLGNGKGGTEIISCAKQREAPPPTSFEREWHFVGSELRCQLATGLRVSRTARPLRPAAIATRGRSKPLGSGRWQSAAVPSRWPPQSSAPPKAATSPPPITTASWTALEAHRQSPEPRRDDRGKSRTAALPSQSGDRWCLGLLPRHRQPAHHRCLGQRPPRRDREPADAGHDRPQLVGHRGEFRGGARRIRRHPISTTTTSTTAGGSPTSCSPLRKP